MRTVAKKRSDSANPSRAAWLSLLLFPVSFALAMVIGEGIAAAFGHPTPSMETTPWWVIAVAFLVAAAVFAAPLVVVAQLCRRASVVDSTRAKTPLWVALTVVASFVGLNLTSGVAQLLLR
jgi:cation transporter-like permease